VDGEYWAHAVHSIMQHWDKHSYRWYCYNCNQLMVSTGQGEVWQCPTCTYLDSSKGTNGPHWDFGVCEHCENLGPAEMCCVTCLVSDYNQNTYQALKKVLMMYKDELFLLLRRKNSQFGQTIIVIWKNNIWK
jgi:hypothetical protein